MSEERLNSEIEELCKGHGDWVPLKRRKKSRNDDQVTISLTGFAGDEEIDALRSEKEQFVLGTSQIIPELEKKILGLKASESFQAAVQQVGKTFARLDVDSSGDLTWEEFEGGAAMVGVAALELGESENIKALRDGFR